MNKEQEQQVWYSAPYNRLFIFRKAGLFYPNRLENSHGIKIIIVDIDSLNLQTDLNLEYIGEL